MIDNITLTADQIDELPGEILAQIVGDLSSRSNDQGSDASHTTQWADVQGKTWSIPCYILQVGVRAIMWSMTDEAGAGDITVADAESDLADQIREFAEDLAHHIG